MKTEKMHVIIVDGGGRGHALTCAIGKSPRVAHVVCTPGNGGIQPENRRHVKDSDLSGLIRLAKEEKPDLVVFGSEGPLVAGYADVLRTNGIAVFGPSGNASELEGSKIFTKTRCRRWDIPTARFDFAGAPFVAERIIKDNGYRVVKADGLCAGKGVVLSDTEEQAIRAVAQLKSAYPDAARRVLLEDRLVGRECSVMTFCDGENAIALPTARDFKRVFNDNEGPNTGGMASFSPVPDVSEENLKVIMDQIIAPTLAGMKKEDTPYFGILYAGIMNTPDFGPMLLEYNVRPGDPEIQSILARIESDIVDYILACLEPGGLSKLGPLKVSAKAAACTVLTKEGYPGAYEKGALIYGLDKVPEDVSIFHAGTERTAEGFVTVGGRVLNIVALADTVDEACQRSREVAEMITFEGKHYRTDICSAA